MVHVKDIVDKKDPYAAAEELARESIESIKEYQNYLLSVQ